MKTTLILLAASLVLGLAPALHAQTTVTTTADIGPGSLRQAITSATTTPTTITFTPGFTGPIVLSSELVIPAGKTITVDASGLAGGLVIDGGPGANRIFSVNSSGNLTLKGLTLTGGNGTGAVSSSFGGAIFNSSFGTLTLMQCSLSGNSASTGGAIYNLSTLTLTQCTLSGNSASGTGGAIYTSHSGTLTHCTLSGNSASYGGAIFNARTLTLTHCTLSGNSASGSGGAILNSIGGSGTLTLANTLVAGNTSPIAPDMFKALDTPIPTTTGKNLIGNESGSGLTAGTTVIVNAPNLSPLGNYGGPTQTMLPLAGSPAIDPSGGDTTSTLTTDQRGSVRAFGGIVDIGAVEVGLVVTNNADTGAGSLRHAVANAGTGGMVINFSPTLASTITLTPGNGTINLTNNVEINAEGLTNGITVNGASQNFRLFNVSQGKTVAMHNLRLINGGGTGLNGFGGAIRLGESSNLSLTRCNLSGNKTDSTESGGAIEVTTGSVLTMTDCTLSGNQAGFGGAITAVGNAFPSDVATVTLNRCTLNGNQALNGYGGAIHGYHSRVSLTQCTVASNTATGTVPNNGHGGGIFCLSSYLTLNHCTVAENTANGDANNGVGGGVFADGNFTGGFAIANTIIASNTAAAPNATDGPDFHESGNTGVLFTGRVFLGSVKGTDFSASDEVLTGNADLATLGSYGGPTQTMPPQSGSPVIDAASATVHVGTALNVSFPTDQRGAPRAVDGDGNTTALADLGAAEYVPAQTLQVTTTADSGLGSLRQAMAYAGFITSASTVTFAPALSGQTLSLTSGDIVINATSNVTVDASTLTAGLTISGNSRNRLFTVPNGATLTLQALTLTGGNGTGALWSSRGGAIDNLGTLTLTQCTLSGNSASSSGGAIFNLGTLTLNQCSLSANSAGVGGAISNGGTLTLTQCTLSGNSASSSGGAIFNYDALTLTNTIVAGNTAPIGPDIGHFGVSVTPTGSNLIGDVSGSGLTDNGTTVITGDAKLKPLANYGGLTQTMQPRPGSPAIDAAVGSNFLTDQRGVAVILTADIGACEASKEDMLTVEFGPDSPTDLTSSFNAAWLLAREPAIIDRYSTEGSSPIVMFSPSDLAAWEAGTVTYVVNVGLVPFSVPAPVVPPAPAPEPGARSSASGPVAAAEEAGGYIIDASNLPKGVNIVFSGKGVRRIFEVESGAKLTLKGLTLTDGNDNGGGAIQNDGTLSLENCTLSENASTSTGGAVRNSGTFTATGCAFLNNTAPNNGGAFANNSGTATFTNCTFFGNSMTANNTQGGGALNHTNGATSMTLIHCTIVGNTATGSDGGGGIRNRGPQMVLQNCILSANTAPNGPGPDLFTEDPISLAGVNFISTPIAGTGSVGGLLPNAAAPLLAPLGDYGGPTQTMPPLRGSPVIEAAGPVPSLSTDQRGLSRSIDGDGDGIGVPDSGATEHHLILVDTRADENDATATLGSGISLREAVRDITSGGTVGFDPALFDGSTTTANTLILTIGPLNPQVNCELNAQPIQGGMTVLHQPTIYQQPQSLSLPAGAAAPFGIVVANASGGISTQWRFNGDGSTFAGFPNPTFSFIINTAPTSTGVYDVVLGELPTPGTLTLTNVALTPFSALSQPATLIVNGMALTILRQPISAMLPVGGSTTLGVVAAGPPPPQPALKYQWFKAGKAIAGATKSTLAIINAQLTHAGAYSCVVSSGFTKVASSTAEIGVVNTRPMTVNLRPGARFSPTVLAAGNGLTFQWYLDGGIVPSADKGFTLSPVTVDDEGLYTCTVSGPAGTLSNGFNTRLNVLTGPPVLDAIGLPVAVITTNYFYQIPELAPTTNRKATSFSVTGLPPGLKCNPITGVISGRPTAANTAGYRLTIKASNLQGSVTATPAPTLNVIAMPDGSTGTFAGVGARHVLNDNLGARFDLTTTIAGTCSGSVTLGGRAKQPFTNQLLKSFGTSDGVISASIPGLKMADTTPLSAQVDINLFTGLAQFTLTHPDGSQLIIPAWRKTTPVAAAQFNFRLDPGTVAGAPQGYGYGSFKVATTNALTFTGKLPDNTALTGSTFVGPNGEVLVFQLLHGNKGSLVGQYAINGNALNGTLTWSKPLTTGTIYKEAFGPITVTAAGGLYTPPAAGQLVMQANSKLTFSDGGLDPQFTQLVTIANPSATGLTNTAVPSVPINNTTKITKFDVKAGTMTGSFLIDTRSAPWSGQLVTIGATTEGYGFFLLPTGVPTNTTSPKLSGKVRLSTP